MPIHCSELTNIIYYVISKNIENNVIECIGPETLTFKEILEKLLKLIQKKNFDPFPLPLAKISAFILGKLPKPLLTSDQLRLLNMIIFHQESIKLILISVYQVHFYLKKK